MSAARTIAWRWGKAWLALAVALVPGVLAGALGFFLYAMGQPSADGREHHFAVTDILGNLVLVGVLALPFVLLFALLAAPFVPFQRWIVGPTFPFLRFGYVGVAAYGPLLLAIAYRDGGEGYLLWSVLYEVVALVATALFIPLGRRFGAFDAAH